MKNDYYKYKYNKINIKYIVNFRILFIFKIKKNYFIDKILDNI